jgi:hypothetical protein
LLNQAAGFAQKYQPRAMSRGESQPWRGQDIEAAPISIAEFARYLAVRPTRQQQQWRR